jgi:hypothetical protein
MAAEMAVAKLCVGHEFFFRGRTRALNRRARHTREARGTKAADPIGVEGRTRQ